MLIDWEGLSSDRLIASTPQPGGYFVYSPTSVQMKQTGRRAFNSADFEPSSNWLEISRFRGEPTWIGRVVLKLGLEETIGDIGLDRLIWEAPLVILYRRPAEGG